MSHRQDRSKAAANPLNLRSNFVRVIGIPYSAEPERHPDPDKEDHVYIRFEVPPMGTFTAAVNTRSRLNEKAGFDGRVGVGILHSHWHHKPQVTFDDACSLDYSMFEDPIDFQPFSHADLTALLITKTRAAIRLEVWGELYDRPTLGLHQIHCRAASRAVRSVVHNRDGALKFYFPTNQTAELLLFKFDGQNHSKA